MTVDNWFQRIGISWLDNVCYFEYSLVREAHVDNQQLFEAAAITDGD